MSRNRSTDDGLAMLIGSLFAISTRTNTRYGAISIFARFVVYRRFLRRHSPIIQRVNNHHRHRNAFDEFNVDNVLLTQMFTTFDTTLAIRRQTDDRMS